MPRRALLAGALLAAAAGKTTAAEPACPPPAPPSEGEVRLHKDWAFLARYRAANAVDAARPPEARRAVFLGDSITEGWYGWGAVRSPFFDSHGFLGRGISGQTTGQMLVRVMADVVALKPAVLHLMAGTNDVAENNGPFDPQATQDNLTAIAELAAAHRIRVVMASIPPAGEFPWHRGLGPIAKIAGLNAWQRAFAAERGFIYADYTAVLDDGTGSMRPGLAGDGVHPTAAGYAVMEPVALAAVAAALAKPPPRRG